MSDEIILHTELTISKAESLFLMEEIGSVNLSSRRFNLSRSINSPNIFCIRAEDGASFTVDMSAAFRSAIVRIIQMTEDVGPSGEALSDGFDYFECPACQFSSVQRSEFVGSEECPFCAGDSGHSVRMKRRPARIDDKPEGIDARSRT